MQIGFAILGFFLSGFFAAICFGWGGATDDGIQRLVSTFFFYLGFIGIFASFFAAMWKDTNDNSSNNNSENSGQKNSGSTAPASGSGRTENGNTDTSAVGDRSSIEMERKGSISKSEPTPETQAAPAAVVDIEPESKPAKNLPTPETPSKQEDVGVEITLSNSSENTNPTENSNEIQKDENLV